MEALLRDLNCTMIQRHDNPVTIGTSGIWGHDFTLDQATRARHLHIVGQTGTGKSSLLLHRIAQDLEAGRGVCVIDPHGDLANAVLGFVSAERTSDVVYFHPADLEKPIGFNLIDSIPSDFRARVADDVVSAFVHIFGETSVGTRSQQVLRNCLRVLMDATDPASLLCIPKLIADQKYRERQLRSLKDPVVMSYWRDQFDTYSPQMAAEVTAPILNKLDQLLGSPAFRNVVGQTRSTIDFRGLRWPFLVLATDEGDVFGDGLGSNSPSTNWVNASLPSMPRATL